MDHRHRVLNTLEHKGYDRIPVRHFGEPEVNQMLMQHLGVDNELAMLECIGDDFRYIWPDYIGPAALTYPDGSFEIAWPWRWQSGERYRIVEVGGKKYSEEVYRPFVDLKDPGQLSKYPFPKVEWLDYSKIRQKVAATPDHVRVAGYGNVLNFIAGISHSLGMERTLAGFATGDPVLLALMEIKFKFHYEEIEKTLQAAEGGIDLVGIGEDLGTQRGAFISPRAFDKYISPYFDRFFRMVHGYGARVSMHCCGSSRMFIPRLIELGLDILEVIQVSCSGMNLAELKAEFGDRLCFSGSMDVQGFMVTETPQGIEREVRKRLEMFPTGGLILGPSHLVQPDVPLENTLAMYRAAGSLAC
jgi:uroporphyrinogen decarboxylase